MDQFSHDLTIALEETSLMDRARVSRWGQRRRTRSTGNLPCAPQPTEDSSSSPTDVIQPTLTNKNIDGLDTYNITLPSDSDGKEELRLPSKTFRCIATLDTDSLNETFSPARFLKTNARRKRKLKRMSMECEIGNTPNVPHESLLQAGAGVIRKRLLKPELNGRSNLFFCGKRKRSTRDRYHDHDHSKIHSSSMPRNTYWDEYRMRPRSFSNTSKPRSDQLLPLNEGLLSKIERISQQQHNNCTTKTNSTIEEKSNNVKKVIIESNEENQKQKSNEQKFQAHRKKKGWSKHSSHLQQLQFAVAIDQQSMDCAELNEFFSSSSLSSSESDDVHSANDTDREGDDELTDWPGNEGCGPIDPKSDFKRKLTKKSNLVQQKSDEFLSSNMMEDDSLISARQDRLQCSSLDPAEIRFQTSNPITITNRMSGISIPLKEIESEMSGETSNPFLPSPPCQPTEVREIRAGCRRVKGERPGFSIKTSVNERLARFLQDPRQLQIRLPDIEIYEHDSLINLATLYSLQMSLENGCAMLTKTSNTTQSVNTDQQSLQNRLLFSDFKRRCYDSKGNFLARK